MQSLKEARAATRYEDQPIVQAPTISIKHWPKGTDSVLGQANSLETMLFLSQEYINRNRTNGQYVSDLYWGYLHRTYDQGGYDGWMAALNSGTTREQVRQGFALSVEFENKVAGVCTALGGTSSVRYVFMDHQGSARALLDGSGNVLTRHDYLPFGEELWAGMGMRTTAQKFGAMDQSRMRYALTEKDDATGLDHTWWRKYDNSAGRWTSPDRVGGSIGNPQSFNRFSYVQNDPVNFVDPGGLMMCGAECGWTSFGGWGGGYLGGGGWGNDSRPGLATIIPNLNSDVRQTWQVVDPALYEYTSGERGSELLPSTPLVNLLAFLTQNPAVRLMPDQTAAIRDQIAGLLTDKCAKFKDQLVSSQTGKPYDSKTSLLTDFNSIRDGKGGFFFGGTSYGGDASGTLAGGNGTVRLNSRLANAGELVHAAVNSLHEIIHIITGAGDQQLSDRVNKLGIQVIGYPGYTVPYPTDKDNRKLAYSGYWGQALKNACDPIGY